LLVIKRLGQSKDSQTQKSEFDFMMSYCKNKLGQIAFDRMIHVDCGLVLMNYNNLTERNTHVYVFVLIT